MTSNIELVDSAAFFTGRIRIAFFKVPGIILDHLSTAASASSLTWRYKDLGTTSRTCEKGFLDPFKLRIAYEKLRITGTIWTVTFHL